MNLIMSSSLLFHDVKDTDAWSLGHMNVSSTPDVAELEVFIKEVSLVQGKDKEGLCADCAGDSTETRET
jgi:hypothetical protein